MKESPLTEKFDAPAEWVLDREKFPWIDDVAMKWLNAQSFDYGNIMAAVSYFLTKEQVADRLGVQEADLEKYCQTVWNRSWNTVYTILLAKAKECGVDLFKYYAGNGNSTALAVMAHSIMKMDKEDSDKSLKVTIVNDLSSRGDE